MNEIIVLTKNNVWFRVLFSLLYTFNHWMINQQQRIDVIVITVSICTILGINGKHTHFFAVSLSVFEFVNRGDKCKNQTSSSSVHTKRRSLSFLIL